MKPESTRGAWLILILGTLIVGAGACEEAGDEEPDREITCAVAQPYPYADVTYVSNHVGPLNADYVPCEGPVVLGVGMGYDLLTRRPYPRWIVGSLRVGSDIPDDIGEALQSPMSGILVEDGSGAATAQAEQLGLLDVPVTLLGELPAADAPS